MNLTFFEKFLRFRLVVPFVSKIKSLAIGALTYIDDAEKKVDSQMIIVSNDSKIFLIKSNM